MPWVQNRSIWIVYVSSATDASSMIGKRSYTKVADSESCGGLKPGFFVLWGGSKALLANVLIICLAKEDQTPGNR